MYYLDRARGRLAEEVESMEAAVEEAGAGGRRRAVARRRQRPLSPRLVYRIEEIVGVCSHGKYVLEADAARRREAELEQDLTVPPESVENARQKGASKWRLRIRRLFRCDRPSN